LSGIQIHDPSVRVSDDSSCLRPRGHCDRLRSNIRRRLHVPPECRLTFNGVYSVMSQMTELSIVWICSPNGRSPITTAGIGIECSWTLEKRQTVTNLEWRYSGTNATKACTWLIQKTAINWNLVQGTLKRKRPRERKRRNLPLTNICSGEQHRLLTVIVDKNIRFTCLHVTDGFSRVQVYPYRGHWLSRVRRWWSLRLKKGMTRSLRNTLCSRNRSPPPAPT
jgi:hypothetical protein